MVAGAGGMEAGCHEQGGRVFDSVCLVLCWALGISFPIMSLQYQFARHEWQLCHVIYLIMVIFLTGFLVIF